MTLVVFDFKDQSLEQVIDKALVLDKTQTSNNMSITSLQKSLPTSEELRFRQAIQGRTCLDLRHSTIECTLRTHCPICHSKAHTINQCKYNLLNKAVALVRQIQPHEDHMEDTNQQHRFRDDDRPRYEDHYWLDRN